MGKLAGLAGYLLVHTGTRYLPVQEVSDDAVPKKIENARNKKSQKHRRSVEFQNFGFAFSGILELFHSSPLLYFLFLSFPWAKIASFNVNFQTTSSTRIEIFRTSFLVKRQTTTTFNFQLFEIWNEKK